MKYLVGKMDMNTDELRKAAIEARKSLLITIHNSKAAHLGSSLSAIELFIAALTVLQEKGQLVISKGHAAAGYYSSLVALGLLSQEELATYGIDGSRLFGHITEDSRLGVSFSTGSLGHGIPYGVGFALGSRLRGAPEQVIVIASDGEMNEGTTWESALLAAHHQLSNLCVVIDRNGIQSIRGTEETLRLEPLGEKWRSFGWKVLEVNGHSFEELLEAMKSIDENRPTVVIARTVKGKGVHFMEHDNKWHYSPPGKDELELALLQLEDFGA